MRRAHRAQSARHRLRSGARRHRRRRAGRARAWPRSSARPIASRRRWRCRAPSSWACRSWSWRPTTSAAATRRSSWSAQSDARARALARLAVKQGARSVAVLAPDSAYGRNMAAAFVDEARKQGARIVADVRYPEASTTFIEPVRRVQQGSPEALFVPAPASQLQLIAPQLASSGVTRLPGVKPVGKLAAALRHRRRPQRQVPRSRPPSTSKARSWRRSSSPTSDEPRAAAFVERYRPPTTRSRPAWTRWPTTPCAPPASRSTTPTAAASACRCRWHIWASRA